MRTDIKYQINHLKHLHNLAELLSNNPPSIIKVFLIEKSENIYARIEK